MRAARIACTVGGIFNSPSGLVSLDRGPSRTSAPSSNNTCTVSSMKNGLPSVRLDDEALERRQLRAIAEQRREHLVGALLAQRIEPQLRVVGLVTPLMRVLGAVVHQQQDLAVAIESASRFRNACVSLVDPVQVLEDHHQRLIERLSRTESA